MANKIKYGLKNVHYAVATISTSGTATYGTVKALPGAVSLSMEPQGENTPFYADNIAYWIGVSNTGYEGDLELARVPDSFKIDVLNYYESANGLLVEDANAAVKHFALMFQFEGDEKATRHVLYNCTATRPTASGQTQGESIEPQTETISIKATTIYFSTIEKDVVKSETYDTTSTSVYNSWFSSVTTPTATTT